jgi:hypothetical protein
MSGPGRQRDEVSVKPLSDDAAANGRPLGHSWTWFRAATLLLAGFLGLQCVWLLAGEHYRSTLRQLPTTALAASAAVQQRDSAALAASIGLVRGELWAESAFSYANLLFDDPGQDGKTNLAEKLASLGPALQRALDEAPTQSGAWLLRAGLALRYPFLGFNALDALKMSYYTSPSAPELAALRVGLTSKLHWSSDVEMRQFVARDLRVLLAQKRVRVIAETYDASSPPESEMIEQALTADQPILRWLRSGPSRKSMTD